MSVQLQCLLTGINFLLNRLDERETLYTINFTKIYHRSFLSTKWNTIICETSMKMAIFNSNGSFYDFYPNLPRISIIHTMSKNIAFT